MPSPHPTFDNPHLGCSSQYGKKELLLFQFYHDFIPIQDIQVTLLR